MPRSTEKVRVAAVADIHVSESSAGKARELFRHVSEDADVLALAGDLTNRGTPREAEVLAEDLHAACQVPVVAVLGNHDYECGHQDDVVRILRGAGVTILDTEPCEIQGVGFAGAKGFCGGFDGHALAPWGEEMIKRFVRETLDEVMILESSLAKLRTEHRVVVLHYAPVRGTVEGEPAEIFPFLGSSRLAEPVDRLGASAVIHGHAHRGSHEGRTLRGTPVYNVAEHIMRLKNEERPYLVLEF